MSETSSQTIHASTFRIMAYYAAILAVLCQIASWIMATAAIDAAWVEYIAIVSFMAFILLAMLGLLTRTNAFPDQN